MSILRFAIVATIICAIGSHAQSEKPVSFQLDIQPILTAHGCNAGACHGKQRGQNGFQLSLLGFDSDFDFAALVSHARGRRLSLAAPESSLLLRKAIGKDPHGGGKRFDVESEPYKLLMHWIAQGAPRSIPNEPTLQAVHLKQTDFSLKPNQASQLSVMATYSDKTTRDVTHMTTYLSNDAAVVDVNETGQLTAGTIPGETAIMARYMNQICVANVLIPQSENIAAAFFETLPANNFIDTLVYLKLQKLSIKPSQAAEQHVLLRRLFTDLIGRLPSADEARNYLESDDPDKREKLVQQLLDRPEYVDHWANQWADLLRPNPYRVGIKTVLAYDNWIREQFRQDVPYDKFVRRLVTAKGSTWQSGAPTLYRDRRSPDEVATMVSQLFLGVRLDCAKCHHHPFERWSQKDFYQFAAFFSKVGHKGTGLSPPISGSEEIIFVSTNGSVKHPVTGETLSPQPLFGQASAIADGDDPRESLADWMTSPENDYFAKVQVNRVWGLMMGRGIVEPVDDLRSTNPPTNPALLDALADHFQQSGYDLKDLIKTIALSNVYALRSEPSENYAADRLNYSRHYRHQFRAEVLLDAIADVSETDSNLPGMAKGSRPSQVWTHRVDSMFLDTFGRPNENQDPPCERMADSSVTQSLHLMNSRELDGRIRSDQSRAKRLAESKLASAQIAQELYLSAFSRLPNQAEQLYTTNLIDSAKNRRGVIEDLMWALINAPEFVIQN